MTEDEMFGWYHQLKWHGFGWTPEVGDGRGGLACYDSWCSKGQTWLSNSAELYWLNFSWVFFLATVYTNYVNFIFKNFMIDFSPQLKYKAYETSYFVMHFLFHLAPATKAILSFNCLYFNCFLNYLLFMEVLILNISVSRFVWL